MQTTDREHRAPTKGRSNEDAWKLLGEVEGYGPWFLPLPEWSILDEDEEDLASREGFSLWA